MIFMILLLGLGVGVLVGLLGIGGGVVLLPAIGVGALREYWKQGQVDLNAGIFCALGMLFGAYAGSLMALPMPSRNLRGLFGCFLMLAGFLLWKKAQLEGRAIGRVAGSAVASFWCLSSGCCLPSASIARREHPWLR